MRKPGRGAGRRDAEPPVASAPVELRIEGIGSDGAGVGRLPDGRVLFVPRTAPGDEVRVQIAKERPRWARGRLLEVRTAGPDRRTPPCPYFEGCGGCTLQHLAYEAQLAAKVGIVRSAIARIGGVEGLPDPVVHASPLETRYRSRVTFVLRRGRSRSVIAGFHASEIPEAIVDIDERCLLPEEPIVRGWGELRAGWGAGAELLPDGDSLKLTLRANRAGEVLLLVSGGRGRGSPELLLERAPTLRAVWVEDRGSGAPELVAGQPIEEEWLGERFELLPRTFLQGNREAAGRLVGVVLREMGEVTGRRVLDLYCGFGLYGREAARRGAGSLGVESEPSAARIAEAHPVEGFRLVRGRVEDRIAGILPADVIVLNPPRVGAAEGVMEALAGSGARRIVYVSCDPATLARDLGRLGREYRPSGMEVFDLFPQTAHVETVLTLTKG